MGYSFFVCRVSGKISTNANAKDIVIEGNNWRVTISSDYDEEDQEYIQYDYTIINDKKKGKLIVTEEYYDTLCNDLTKLEGSKTYLSARIMRDWSGFWELVDNWTKNRKNTELIEKIRGYMY